MKICLPKLNNLKPTLESTIFKAVEETGELSQVILKFIPYQHLSASEISGQSEPKKLLLNIAQELLDVAQTCVTMIFVMEDSYNIKADGLVLDHLEKLTQKGYCYDKDDNYYINDNNFFKYLYLPRLYLKEETLLTTVCKIQEELGELTQFIGKGCGASGENASLSPETALKGAALEMLDVVQCCFTMLYILAENYHIDIKMLLDSHLAKLKNKGYYA